MITLVLHCPRNIETMEQKKTLFVDLLIRIFSGHSTENNIWFRDTHLSQNTYSGPWVFAIVTAIYEFDWLK
jgi:hypothetical protein